MFDVLTSEDLISHAWATIKNSTGAKDIHTITGRVTNALIHESMVQASLDNLTIITVTFQSFEDALKAIHPSSGTQGFSQDYQFNGMAHPPPSNAHHHQ